MKRIINLIVVFTCLSALILSCSEKREEEMINVKSIAFTGIPENDTIVLLKDGTHTVNIITDPPNAPVRFYSNAGNVFRIGQNTGKITAVGGGIGSVIAVAPNGDEWTRKICTVVVNDVETVAGKKNLFYLYTRTASDVRRVNLYNIFNPQPPSAFKSWKVFHSNDTDFQLNTANQLSYLHDHSSPNQDESHETTATIEFTCFDNSKSSENLTFRNASHLNIMYCCNAYQGFGYYPGGLFDSALTGGWHSSESNSGNHAGSSGRHPHFIVVDFKEALTMNGIEIWRSTTDVRDIEIYYVDPSETLSLEARSSTNFNLTADSFEALKDLPADTYIPWGSISFGSEPSSVNRRGFEGPVISTRYLVVKLATGNRGNSFNITEIYPYIVL